MREQVLIYIITFLLGALFTFIINRIQNKTRNITYSVLTNRIGIAADDPVFGAVRVLWRNNQVRNLYLSTITIENSTDKDCENFELKLYTEQKTILLTEQPIILGTPYILEWSANFKKRLEVVEGKEVTQAQQDAYNHEREYFVKVFNRGQKIQISILSSRPNDDLTPDIFVSTLTKGIEIKKINKPYVVLYEIFGVPIANATVTGLVILFLIVISAGFLIKNSWLAVIICAICGSISNLLGALFCKLWKSLSNLVSK